MQYVSHMYSGDEDLGDEITSRLEIDRSCNECFCDPCECDGHADEEGE